ncbi:MAG: hypothetical protein ACYC3W_10170 [Candidatus Nanopelagicales bacterium]
MRADETPNDVTLRANMGPEHRRPYWIVGLALLGLVVVLLAGAFLLDKQLRPRVGIESPPVVATTAKPTSPPQAIAPPTVRPTPEPTATATPAALGAAPTTTEGPGGLRMATSPLEREIEAAYENYLRVYSEAVLNLDTSHLSEVLAGRALQLVTEEVDDLKARGRPGKIIEDERVVAFGRVTETSATVVDEYVSHSVYVDPNTKEPLPRSGPPIRVRQSYELRKVNGVWKIVDGTRETLGEVNP